MTWKCECSDPGCPVHIGENCQNWSIPEEPGEILYRVDMEDKTGVAFCQDCADDAMESGLFRNCA